MSVRRSQLVLVGVLCFGLALAVRSLVSPLVRVDLPAPAPRGKGVRTNPRLISVDSLTARMLSRDPFRFTQRPAAVAYDPLRLAEQLAPPAPKPVLQLAGIVWEGGRDPTALVAGLPGVEGLRVVRIGDLIGGLRIRSITIDAVRLVGLDTTWVLKLREP